jgi:hypothetical protein
LYLFYILPFSFVHYSTNDAILTMSTGWYITSHTILSQQCQQDGTLQHKAMLSQQCQQDGTLQHKAMLSQQPSC